MCKSKAAGITILPLEEMALELGSHITTGKPCIVIRYAQQNGFYRFVAVDAGDIPPGESLRFSEIATFAAKTKAQATT